MTDDNVSHNDGDNNGEGDDLFIYIYICLFI